MKTLFLVLLLSSPVAHATNLGSHCVLTEELGGSEPTADGWIIWNSSVGPQPGSNSVTLETSGAKATLTLSRDLALPRFLIKGTVLDKTTNRTSDVHFFTDEGITVRTRPEGSISVTCDLEA
ncbi:MAG: hypothetical protein ACXVB9_07485 [Bdellovibrionota bacterium]